MDSWWPIVMLALAGFFIGGTISFIKARIIVLAIGCAIAAALCITGAVLWWQ